MSNLVLASNVKCDGQIIKRVSEVSVDHPFYKLLKPYLVQSAELMQGKQGTSVRIAGPVNDNEMDVDMDIPAATKITKKTATPEDADDQTQAPATVEDPRTKAELMAELDEKKIAYDPKAKKADLLALVNAE